MDKKREALLIKEYASGSVGYRSLAKKYGVSISSISRMINKSKENQSKPIVCKEALEDMESDDVESLKEEIRKLKLKVELQDLIIDISSKELGIDLRKKRGTRQS